MRTRLQSRLIKRQQQSLLRQRRCVTTVDGPWVVVEGQRLLNCCSNDYLGLTQHPDLIAASVQTVRESGVGSGGSHLLTGHFVQHQQVEERLAAFVGAERALLFSSGYMANLAVISTLASRHDVVLADRLNHASLLDAVRLAGARSQRYRHVDVINLEAMLEITTSRSGRMIATDAVFSMDGDVAPLHELQQLADRYPALLYVDEAHGFGVLGQGRGALAAAGILPAGSVIMMGTLGKACGVGGAFVAADRDIIDGLIQFGRSYIYTTALPPAQAATVSAALIVLQKESWRRQKVLELAQEFRHRAVTAGLPLMPSATPIQPLLVGDSASVLAIWQRLWERGFLVAAIRPPTVAAGSARLRITLTAAMDLPQVQQLVSALVDGFGFMA
ncbi:MAG TPA: 8-amino-7-oxononanoate synthase [Gammaproteobacteria bacterium]|nr:8-amino-7-oxononanoate synthase [Gammaproteobacteria bacterium]